MTSLRFLNTFLVLIALGIGVSSPAEEKSADQIDWEKQVGEKQLDNPAYAYVADDPALPRVLLIGDSISIGYTPYVREKLAGKANVHRIPVNGGDTNRGQESLAAWLGKGKWDVIHFNWGLHDLKRIKDGKLDSSAPRSLSPEEYARNLQALTGQLKETGARLIWCATTPVPEGAAGRTPGDEVTYNAKAMDIMKAREITVNDLHGFVLPKLATMQRPANVHFTPEGSEFLGEEVARCIWERLSAP